ncbi:signal recognition particle 9 kDa protein-domain-containing protein [Phyllosticta citribraziliensis]|uniref:Signal recognition particle 9 kDa protein-domain-containing protein n=1 Tax=Phyllosticta citribraziliensis TaxID=989973 RepID=A0ABR1L5X5_9PEZI
MQTALQDSCEVQVKKAAEARKWSRCTSHLRPIAALGPPQGRTISRPVGPLHANANPQPRSGNLSCHHHQTTFPRPPHPVYDPRPSTDAVLRELGRMARAIRAAAESATNNRAQTPPPPTPPPSPHHFRTAPGSGESTRKARSPARIVTKYSILQRHEGKQIKRRDKAAEKAAAGSTSANDADKDSAATEAAAVQDRRQQPAQPDRPKAVLVIKTYDPASGVCLKYKTNKAAEVGRLVASLEKLARTMAALPDKPDDRKLTRGFFALADVPMLDAPAEQGTGTSTPNPDAKVEAKPSQGGGGGGKRKKKGKK